MAKALRVFEIAKELGVNSKAIVAKCKAEAVPGITNHMSTVKLGLAATIREWFSEGETEGADETGAHTAVETAEKVDLKKVRKKAARKKATPKAEAKPAAAPKPEPQVEAPAAAAVDEPPVVEAPAETPEPAPEQPAQPPEAETPAIAAEVTPEPPAEVATPASQAMGQVNVPDRPTDIKPAGEQLKKPESATLKGPKVIRIEKADPVQAAPRRNTGGGRPAGGGGRPSGGGGDGGGGGYDPNTPGITRSRGPVRGKGAGGGAAFEDDSKPRSKRRSQSTRRGRSADAIPLARGKMSEQDLIELDARLRGATGFLKQRRRTMKSGGGSQAQTPADVGGKVEISEPITIKALSAATGIKSASVIKWLFDQGIMATINSAIDTEAAMEVAMEYEIELVVKEKKSAQDAIVADFEARPIEDERRRPPVVAVLGHVDHGKTSLLDRIRTEDVAAHEAGGITQHVGAYRVTIKGGDDKDKTVVFLDTPGHEAFTTMRARGASMTDIIVLVVAADDGVMPQTIESINHAKAAGVPIVVALNKIDVPQATEDNIRKIYGQLAEHGLNPVEWGGETEVVRTSAEQGTGVTDLLETLDYQAELLETKADYGGPARGIVIESEMQSGRGPVARVLVQQGNIKVGDFIVIGRAFGRVREMTDDRDRSITAAGPATPLELSGIDMIPNAGDKFYICESLQRAENIAKQYRENERQTQLATQTKVTLDNFAQTLKDGATKDLRVVLKADVQGSIDVLHKSITKIGNTEVAVKVIHSAVGGVTESDVLLADASDAIIIGFHVVANPAVRDIADERNVEIRLYRVIYDVIDEVTKALEGMLTPETKEERLGEAEVREVFRISKLGNIAGCIVSEGVIQKSATVRVVRDEIVVTEGRKIESLRRVKDDAREVRVGTECGIRVVGFDDLKPGDKVVCYNVETVARKLD